MTVDTTTALHNQALDAVAGVIAALSIGRGTEDRVFKLKTYETAGVITIRPCVLVTLDESRDTCEPHSTEDDEHVLPVMVTLLDRKDRKNQDDLPGWLLNRQALKAAFLMQLLPGVSQNWHIDVRPLDVIELEALKGPGLQDAIGSIGLTVRCVTPRVRAAHA